CRSRGQGPARAVVDELRVDTVEAAEDRKPRTLLGPRDVDGHAPVALRTVVLAVLSLDHALALALLPALPGLRRTFSPAYFPTLPWRGARATFTALCTTNR